MHSKEARPWPSALDHSKGIRSASVVHRALGRVLQERVPVPTSQRRRTATGRTRTQQGLSRPSQYEPRHANCRVCESCGDSAPLDGLASRGVFPSAGGFHLGTQWPDKPATRRKQMRECLSGRVVDVRSDVCWVYRIVKLVTRRRRTHQHLAERVAGVQVDVRWVHFVGEPATQHEEQRGELAGRLTDARVTLPGFTTSKDMQLDEKGCARILLNAWSMLTVMPSWFTTSVCSQLEAVGCTRTLLGAVPIPKVR